MVDKIIIGTQIIYKINYHYGNEWHKEEYNEIAVWKSNDVSLEPLSTPNLLDSSERYWVKYKELVYKHVKELFDGEFTADQMWYSEYPYKSYIKLHNHYKASVVSVGYISVDEQDSSSSLVVQSNVDNSFVDIPVSNGDILIFNANIMHKSRPNMSKTVRKLVGLNYRKIIKKLLV